MIAFSCCPSVPRPLLGHPTSPGGLRRANAEACLPSHTCALQRRRSSRLFWAKYCPTCRQDARFLLRGCVGFESWGTARKTRPGSRLVPWKGPRPAPRNTADRQRFSRRQGAVPTLGSPSSVRRTRAAPFHAPATRVPSTPVELSVAAPGNGRTKRLPASDEQRPARKRLPPSWTSRINAPTPHAPWAFARCIRTS